MSRWCARSAEGGWIDRGRVLQIASRSVERAGIYPFQPRGRMDVWLDDLDFSFARRRLKLKPRFLISSKHLADGLREKVHESMAFVH
jgi:hypothetical protein